MESLKTMKAAVLKAYHQPLVIEDVKIPVPTAGQVLVRVRASGLCASDLHIQDGVIGTVCLPHIPGHEIAGEVWQTGSDTCAFKRGDRVIVGIDVTCGHCRFCESGRGNLCKALTRTGFELYGGHAEYVLVREEQLFRIPDSLPYPQACIIPDAVACMYHAIKQQGGVRQGDRVLILGAGGLGFQGIQIAKHLGAFVFCGDKNGEKLQTARSLGADVCVDTETGNLYQEIKNATHAEMCDVVVDTVGIRSSIELGLELVRPGGKIVAVGYQDEDFTVWFQNLIAREKEIIGMRGSTRREVAETVELVANGIVEPYIYKTCPLEDINTALDELRSGSSLGRIVVVL